LKGEKLWKLFYKDTFCQKKLDKITKKPILIRAEEKKWYEKNSTYI
jgi:hypothetical protein